MNGREIQLRITALQADAMSKGATFHAAFEKISGRGKVFSAVLPRPRSSLLLVGGSRNAAGALPTETRTKLEARFKAVVRAGKVVEDTMDEYAREQGWK